MEFLPISICEKDQTEHDRNLEHFLKIGQEVWINYNKPKSKFL